MKFYSKQAALDTLLKALGAFEHGKGVVRPSSAPPPVILMQPAAAVQVNTQVNVTNGVTETETQVIDV